MTFEQKVKEMKQKMFDIISTKDITNLKDLDIRIIINKSGKFNYHTLEFGMSNIWGFLYGLESNKVYTLIPILTVNNRSDEPNIVLSQQILVTHNSNAILISKYIYNKINNSEDLYNTKFLDNFILLFKYKSVEINFKEHNTFS